MGVKHVDKAGRKAACQQKHNLKALQLIRRRGQTQHDFRELVVAISSKNTPESNKTTLNMNALDR